MTVLYTRFKKMCSLDCVSSRRMMMVPLLLGDLSYRLWKSEGGGGVSLSLSLTGARKEEQQHARASSSTRRRRSKRERQQLEEEDTKRVSFLCRDDDLRRRRRLQKKKKKKSVCFVAPFKIISVESRI